VRALVTVAIVVGGPLLFAGSQRSDDIVSAATKQCDAGNYPRAKLAALAEVKIHPSDPRLWSCLGLANAELGQTDAAVNAYKRTLALDPKAGPIWFRLADLYISQHQPQRAIESFRRGLLVDPGNSAANRNYGLLLLQAGKFQNAIVPLRTALKAGPENRGLQLALIEASLHVDKGASATAPIQSFMKSATVDDQLQLTSVLIRAQQFDRAQTILDGVNHETPGLPEVHAQKGLILMEREQFEQAATELGQAVLQAPDAARYSLALAEVLLRWHHYATALEFLHGVEPRFGTLPQFRYNVAYSHYGMRQFEPATKIATALLKEHPEFAAADFLLGNCLVAQGYIDGAEEYFQKALQSDPTKPAYYSSLVQLKRNEGKMTEAFDLLKKGLAVAPGDSDLILEAALCHEKQGEFAKAQVLLERIVAQKPASIVAHRVLARVYGRLGNTAKGDNEKRVLAELEAGANAAKSNTANSTNQ